jgi:nicotinate-nucleotide adenylyltransferase
MMKTGLFGGTFNPFHNGHIRIIEHVKQNLGFDKIFIIPSATPPHKPDLNLAPAQDRYDMVRESIKNKKGLIVSDKEIIRGGNSFTIDTIRLFKEELGSTADIFFIMGSDAFWDIDIWKQKDRIFDEIKIIIMLRYSSQNQHDLASFIAGHVSEGYQYNEAEQSFTHRTKKTIYVCKVPLIDISSTMIREWITHGKSIEGLVPSGVLTIIQAKGLYK